MGTPTVDYNFRELGLQSAGLPPVDFETFFLLASNQRVLGPPHPPNTIAPLALRASYDGTTALTLDNAVSAVQSLQSNITLTRKLAEHGTLLFRDLPIHSAEDLRKFGHGFGFQPYEVIGTAIDLHEIASNVVPSNEPPKEVLIYNHNESPRTPHAPGYIFLYSHRMSIRRIWRRSRVRFACCISGGGGMCWSLIMLRYSMDGSRGTGSKLILWCLRICGTEKRRGSTRGARTIGHR